MKIEVIPATPVEPKLLGSITYGTVFRGVIDGVRSTYLACIDGVVQFATVPKIIPYEYENGRQKPVDDFVEYDSTLSLTPKGPTR